MENIFRRVFVALFLQNIHAIWMQEEIQANYNRVKQEVQQIITDEIERIKNDPNLEYFLLYPFIEIVADRTHKHTLCEIGYFAGWYQAIHLRTD